MQSIEVELKQAIQNAVKKAFDLDLDVQNIVVETPKNYFSICRSLFPKATGTLSSRTCRARRKPSLQFPP